jgi:hypothetical protein
LAWDLAITPLAERPKYEGHRRRQAAWPFLKICTDSSIEVVYVSTRFFAWGCFAKKTFEARGQSHTCGGPIGGCQH